MSDSSFAAMAITHCSTQKATLTGGFSTYLTGLMCTPLSPIDAETRTRMEINTPNTLYEAHLQGSPDIRAGHRLIIGVNYYPIKTVESYYWHPASEYRVKLIVEELRN